MENRIVRQAEAHGKFWSTAVTSLCDHIKTHAYFAQYIVPRILVVLKILIMYF